jgi:DNA polymerase-3 subunit beta
MKINSTASVLAAGLEAACSLPTGKAQVMAHLVADNGVVTITCTNGNVSLEATIEVQVVEAGEITVDANKIAALIDAFDPRAMVIVRAHNGAAHIIGDLGHYTLPLAEAPIPLAIAGKASDTIEISGADALRLFEVVEAADDDKIRPYLAGVHLDSDHDGWLTSVATNGALLMLATAKAAVKITGATIPSSAVEIATKLIKTMKPAKVSLRRNDRLLEITGEAFRYTTRLIETAYPDWKRILPQASENMAVIARHDLTDALARLAAIVDAADKASPLVSLTWSEGSHVEIALLRAGVGTSKIGAKKIHGTVRVALSLKSLRTLAEHFNSRDIMLEAAPNVGVAIHDDRLEFEPPGGPAKFRLTSAKFGMLSFSRWTFEDEKEAAA